MTAKMNMKIDLRNVQEQIEDNVKNVQHFSRKMVLAYAGMWGLAYDRAQDLMTSSKNLVDKAEKRGEEIETEWTNRFHKLQEQPDVKKVVDYVEDQVDGVSKNAKQVVTEVEKFLARVNVTGKGEEAAKTVAIKVEAMAETVAEKARSLIDGVIEGYDELPAKDILTKLEGLSKEKLQEIRDYEVKNKNRVTVLRELDALLGTPETVTA